MESLPSGEKQA